LFPWLYIEVGVSASKVKKDRSQGNFQTFAQENPNLNVVVVQSRLNFTTTTIFNLVSAVMGI
jgi:hypothetical protein